MNENGAQTWTLYDGSDPIMDFNSSGSLEMRYLNGPTGDLVDTVIARESAGGTVAWYLPDRLGTVRDLINNSGTIIDHIDFSAFGTVLDQSDPSEGDRMMGFAGMELDSVTGMNLAVYRVQNPGTGRWTSQDPLGFGAGDADLSAFVGNDPSTVADPTGLDPTVPVSLPIRNPINTIILVGPPKVDKDGDPVPGDNHLSPESHFCVAKNRGGLAVPNARHNIKRFNGQDELKRQIDAIIASYPGGLPADLDIVIYSHGGPGGIAVGYGPRVIVNLDNEADYHEFINALLPLFKAQPQARLFLTGCSTAGEVNGVGVAEGKRFLNKVKKDLGGITVFGTYGHTTITGPIMKIDPGGNIAVPF
jgi:RHS repeat-associated protein